jgi:hypothetical protein
MCANVKRGGACRTMSSEWYQAEGSSFKARWKVPLEEPLGDFDKTGRRIELSHNEGRSQYVTVYALNEGAYTECWLKNGRETFIHPEALDSITKLLSVSVLPLVRWAGPTQFD